MQYTKVEQKSWLERVAESLVGILVGVLLFLGTSAGLWWNEGEFVHKRDALLEAEAATVEMPDPSQVDPALEGKMVHAVAFADTGEVLRDPVFGLGGRAIALSRSVEFYQWKENVKHEKRDLPGGGQETVTTYSYEKDWVDQPIRSSSFAVPEARSRHLNTQLMDLKDETFYASEVDFGAYFLPPFLIHKIGGAEVQVVKLDPSLRNALNSKLAGRSASRFTGFGSWQGDIVHEMGKELYLGPDPSNPQIGDLRLTFTLTPTARVSLLAKVVGDTFEHYQTKNGKEISVLNMGEVSAEKMYEGEQRENKMSTWIFRLVGAVLLIIAIRLLMRPLSVVLSVIPFLGNIADAGVNLVSILLGLAWSCVVIALAWLAYRPVLALVLLALAAVFIILCQMRGKADAANAA